MAKKHVPAERDAPGVDGKRLKKMRERLGLSLLRAMPVVRIYPSKLSELESNARTGVEVNSGTLKRLCLGYGCSADYLLGLSDDPTPPVRRVLPPEGSSRARKTRKP